MQLYSQPPYIANYIAIFNEIILKIYQYAGIKCIAMPLHDKDFIHEHLQDNYNIGLKFKIYSYSTSHMHV